jgi:hypothetical protein
LDPKKRRKRIVFSQIHRISSSVLDRQQQQQQQQQDITMVQRRRVARKNARKAPPRPAPAAQANYEPDLDSTSNDGNNLFQGSPMLLALCEEYRAARHHHQVTLEKRNNCKKGTTKRKRFNDKLKNMRNIFTMVAYEIAIIVENEAFLAASRRLRTIKFNQNTGWKTKAMEQGERMDQLANQVAEEVTGWEPSPPPPALPC